MWLLPRTALSACLISAVPLMATADETPGQELAELIFDSIGDDPDAAIDMGAFVDFGRDIFVSMDFDESGSVNMQEFTDWDFGFNFIAEDEGQAHAYRVAQHILFATWDHDGNGDISGSEYHKSMVWDFRRADLDNDAFLTRGEFLTGYIVISAYRAAISAP